MDMSNNSAVENFLSKFGDVLSRVKDTIFKDFLDGLVDEGTTWEQFRSRFDEKGFNAFEEFVNAVVKKVGYDISGATESKEVYNLVKSVIVSSEKIAKAVKEFAGEVENTDLDKLIGEYLKTSKDKEGESKLVKFDELLTSKDADGVTMSVGDLTFTFEADGDFAKLKAIIDLFVELFDLIKKITEIEWDKIVDEHKEFGKFIKETYFTKEFGKRLIDYVLITFMKNARAVFEDDVKQIVFGAEDELEKFLASLNIDKDVAKGIIEKVKNYRDEIKKIEEQLKKLPDLNASSIKDLASAAVQGAVSAGMQGSVPGVVQDAAAAVQGAVSDVAQGAAAAVQDAASAVQDAASAVQDAVATVTDEAKALMESSRIQLDAYKKVAEQKLQALISEICPDYSEVSKVLDRIYAVLEFVGVIDKERVDLVSFIKEKTDVIDKVSESPAGDLIDPALEQLAEIKIPTFHWDVVEQLFTKPKDYLKEKFPLESYDDVEKLISRVGTLIKAFNIDFPQMQSIKQFLWDILARIEKRLSDTSNELVSSVKKKFEDFKDFIVGVLKIVEAIAIETRNVLVEAFNNAKNDTNNVLVLLKNSVSGNLEKIQQDVSKAIETNLCPKGGKVPDVLKEIVWDTLVEAAEANLKKCYKESNLDDVKKKLQDQLKKSETKIKTAANTFVNDFQKDINSILDKKAWEARYEDFVKEIKEEFEKQTKNVPASLDEIKNYGKDSLDKLLKGESLVNPFSDFEPSAFYEIVMDHLSKPLDTKFVDDCKTFVTGIKNEIKTACSCIETILKGVNTDAFDINQFVLRIAQDWLDKIKSKIMDKVVRPYINALKSVVRDWISEIAAKIVNTVKSYANQLMNNFDKYDDMIDGAEVRELVTKFVQLTDEAKSIESWHDGLTFAYHIIQCIPDAVKREVTELIGFPKLSLPSVKLPKYSLDVENKFLAVNVWEFKNKDKTKGDCNISIQLVLCVGEREIDGNSKEGLYLLPVFTGKYAKNFNVGSKHYMSFSADANLNLSNEKKSNDSTLADNLSKGKLGFFFSCGDKNSVQVKFLADKDCVSAYLKLMFERGQVNDSGTFIEGSKSDAITIFDTSIASMTIKNYPQTIFVGYNDGFDLGYSGAIEDLKLDLKLKNQNSFFDAILQEDISVSLDKLNVMYSLKKGFQVENDLHIKLPLANEIDLSAVKFNNLALDLGLTNGDLTASLLTSFTADLKGVAISFANLGVGVSCNVFGKNGGRGTFKITPAITYPDGIGIAIDTSAVKGAGAIQWDLERGRFFGAVELNILEKIGASTMLLFTTGKGTDPFSFAGALCVYFNPGIQVGMGFSINGLGGSLGVNRMLSVDNLRGAVYDGSLESVLFFKDIAKNFDKVLANIDKYYPIKTGQMYFGFLAKIAWGSILTADLGLFIQAPSPVVILVAGIIKVRVSESADKLLAINANFIGGIQFDKGFFFDASLFDSKIVGLDLHGDMAMRIYWGGDTKGFILTIGGFHPQYKPESGFNLPDLKRVGVKLDYSILKLSLDAYFAITSNTVQFGSKLDMKIGWDKFGLIGYASFNALFQFKPFKFMVDMSAGLAVKVGSKKICSVDLAFELAGPAPWRAKGKASFHVLFIKISVSFDKSWGKNQIASNRTYADVLPIFREQLKEKNNWKFISSDLTDNLVNLVNFGESSLVLQPSDTISFVQSAVPLSDKIECFGEDEVNDYNCLEIESVYIGKNSSSSGKGFVYEKSSFAPTLTKRMSDKEKLKSVSFEKKNGGFRYVANVNGKNNGAVTNYENAPEINCPAIENSFMNLWQQEAQRLANSNSVSSQKKIPSVRTVLKASKPVIVAKGIERLDVSQKSEPKIVMKSSYRRTSGGFNRYVKQMDQYLAKK